MRDYKIDIIILAVSLIIAVIIYPFLPEQIPYHFQMNGSVSNCAKEYIFLMALIPEVAYRGYVMKHGKKG